MNVKTTTMMLFGKALPKGLLLAALLSVSAPTLAAEYWLSTQARNINIQGVGNIPMWAFRLCKVQMEDTGEQWECEGATVPGPALFVPAGDPNGLTVHLRNTLPEPVSLIINGQNIGMTPVWNDGTTGPRTSDTQRVRSFTHEAPARNGTVNGRADYHWPTIRPGTYLYQSGTHPQVQVQMGLYGALNSAVPTGAIKEGKPETNQVYGVTYNKEATLLFSEIDPALHEAVASGTYGNAAGPTSTLNYNPKYFLINGKVHRNGNSNSIVQASAGDKVLLRFLNAGLQNRVPMINGAHLSLIAEDGNAYPWAGNPRQQYSVLLPAAKTIDAIFTAKLVGGLATDYTIFDRRLALNNNATTDGGMMGTLRVQKVGAPPVFSSPSAATQTVAQNALFTAQAAATVTLGNPITYSLDAFPVGMSINETTGLISWTPDSSQVDTHMVTIRASATTGWIANQSFNITVTNVADNPVANHDSYTIVQGTTLSVAALGVLANDSDPDSGTVLTAVNYTPASQGTATGAANGSFSYTPPLGFTGVATFGYVASDGVLLSNPATVTVNVIANRPPVATTDTVDTAIRRNIATTGNIDILVSANTLTVASTAWMKVNDPITVSGAGAPDLTTTILAINGNVLTLASPATVSVTGAAVTVAYTPVVINVLGNDTDPDTAIDPANLIDPATVTIVTSPTQGGVATVNGNGTITYTPSLNFGGADTFTYFVRDTRGAASNTVIVRVNVVM